MALGGKMVKTALIGISGMALMTYVGASCAAREPNPFELMDALREKVEQGGRNHFGLDETLDTLYMRDTKESNYDSSLNLRKIVE